MISYFILISHEREFNRYRFLLRTEAQAVVKGRVHRFQETTKPWDKKSKVFLDDITSRKGLHDITAHFAHEPINVYKECR